MALFCIPKEFVKQLNATALRSNTDISALYEMTSQERRSFFEQYSDKDTAQFINTKFEKAMVSKQQTALLDWAKSVFSPTEKKKPVYQTVIDKINDLESKGILNEKEEGAFLEDLVTDELGIRLSPEEVKTITEKSIELGKAQEELGSHFGDPAYTDEMVNYLKKVKDMNEYIQSRNPSSKLAILTGLIGRGMMLFNPASVVLNIGSNTGLGVSEYITKRLANRTVRGANNQLALDYIKMARRIYKETGFDIARMESIKDLGAAGERVLGETMVHPQGEGKIRAAGRFVQDVVFEKMMGAPDSAFASAHFADTVNLLSLQMTNGDAGAATELMKDAMRLKPETEAGELLRAQAILDAQTATWTNKTWASKFTLGTRQLLNELSGDVRLGDWLDPFVKTGSNVVATGVNYSGLGSMADLGKLALMKYNKQPITKEVLKPIVRNIARAGFGLIAAVLLTSLLSDDDFEGPYDYRKSQARDLFGAVPHSIKLGNQWISTDWLGPLAIPVTAMMYAKKYGKDSPGSAGFQYGYSTLRAAAENLPVIDTFATAVGYFQDKTKERASLAEMTNGLTNDALGQISSRLIPSFFNTIAKAIDPEERKATQGIQSIQAKIPGLRQLLPEKKNIFGETLHAESPLTTILFGSRVKGEKSGPVVDELLRVMNAEDKYISFTDWNRTSSKQIAQFKDKVGEEKFQDATVFYGQELKREIQNAIVSGDYKRMTDEDRIKKLGNLDTKARDTTFARYGFSYVPEKK